MSVLVMMPFAVAAALSVSLVPEGSPADLIFAAAGWITFSAGALFRWWATLYVGGRKNEELAIEGPYSICRNPLYLGSFLLALSLALFLQSFTFAIGLLIATPIYLSITVPWEEAKLQAAFGDEFLNYRSRVPKFIPRFTLFAAPPTIPVRRKGLRGEFFNTLTWMWIPLSAEAVTCLRKLV